MIPTIDTMANEVVLVPDDTGWGWFRRQMAAYPAGTKRMKFAYRGWFDTITNDYDASGKNWNHTNCFGLSFNNAVPKYDSGLVYPAVTLPADFWGSCAVRPYTGAGAYTPGRVNADRITRFGLTDGVAAVGNRSGNVNGIGYQFMNGIGAELTPGVDGRMFSGASADTTAYHMGVDTPYVNRHLFPNGPAFGAMFTGYWEVYASALDKTMSFRTCLNFDSLAGDAMFSAIDAPAANTLLEGDIHGDVVSAWRTDFATCVFPRWLIFRCSHPAAKFVFKEARVQWSAYDGTLLGSETLP